jgi:hypothetical protein
MDTITGMQSVSGSPTFVADRFGVANGAVLVNSVATAWQLPAAVYVQGDVTITMWVNKQGCPSPAGTYGNKLKKKLAILASAQFVPQAFIYNIMV